MDKLTEKIIEPCPADGMREDFSVTSVANKDVCRLIEHAFPLKQASLDSVHQRAGFYVLTHLF